MEKQYARRPPTICCPPFIIYQYVTIWACSSRLYRIEPGTKRADTGLEDTGKRTNSHKAGEAGADSM